MYINRLTQTTSKNMGIIFLLSFVVLFTVVPLVDNYHNTNKRCHIDNDNVCILKIQLKNTIYFLNLSEFSV